MARRLINSVVSFIPGVTGTHREAKVYRDSEWDEYRVVFYVEGRKQTGADYHETDKETAEHTAAGWVCAYASALEWLRYQVADGMEYPDAHTRAVSRFAMHCVDGDILQSAYDTVRG